MTKESTRRLLKLFGIAVTELEETVQGVIMSLGGVEDPAALVPRLEAYLNASAVLMKHWAEVGQLITDTHQRASDQLLATLARVKGPNA